MAQINDNYLKLKAGYLFPEIGRRVKAFAKANPAAKIIRMGIGDVTEPLPPACVEAMHKAVDEMAQRETFRGYGPEQGYDFLREAIAKNDFQSRLRRRRGSRSSSPTAPSATGNILDIFGPDNTIAVTDPVYPVYVDTNVMAGHTGAANSAANTRGWSTSAPRPRTTSRRHPQAEGRHHLPLLAEQSDRHRREQGDAHPVGRVRQGQRVDHPLRRRVRGVHHRRVDPARIYEIPGGPPCS